MDSKEDSKVDSNVIYENVDSYQVIMFIPSDGTYENVSSYEGIRLTLNTGENKAENVIKQEKREVQHIWSKHRALCTISGIAIFCGIFILIIVGFAMADYIRKSVEHIINKDIQQQLQQEQQDMTTEKGTVFLNPFIVHVAYLYYAAVQTPTQ